MVELYRCGLMLRVMKKTDWENQPTFDPDKEEYILFDKDAWLREHGIRETGRNDGQRNFPPADAARLDETHHKILSWINQRGTKCKDEVSQYLSHLTRLLNNIENREEIDILAKRIPESVNTARVDFAGRSERDRTTLTRLEAAIRQGTEEYEDFRKKAQLTRLPDYSGRRNAVLVILGCAMMEIILNASLLKDVNPSGLLGATMQMGLITGVNILMGWLAMGFTLRCCNLLPVLKRRVAWAFAALIGLSILLFNLLVGHFREGLQESFREGVQESSADWYEFTAIGQNVWYDFRGDPFGLDSSFPSTLLVLVGLIAFGIASWKGYQSDDPYPGYGRRDRLLDKLKSKYSDTWSKARDEIEAVSKGHTEKLEDERHKLEIKQGNWGEYCERGRRVIEQYPLQARRHQDDLNHLVAVYRTENQRMRTEPAPSFFEDELSIDGQILEPPSFNPPGATSLEGIQSSITKAITDIQDLYRQTLKEYPTLEEVTARSFSQNNRA